MFGFFTHVTLGPDSFVLATSIGFILSWGFLRIASVLRSKGKVLCRVSGVPCVGWLGGCSSHLCSLGEAEADWGVACLPRVIDRMTWGFLQPKEECAVGWWDVTVWWPRTLESKA